MKTTLVFRTLAKCIVFRHKCQFKGISPEKLVLHADSQVEGLQANTMYSKQEKTRDTLQNTAEKLAASPRTHPTKKKRGNMSKTHYQKVKVLTCKSRQVI